MQVLQTLLKEWHKNKTNKVLVFTKSVKLLEILEYHVESQSGWRSPKHQLEFLRSAQTGVTNDWMAQLSNPNVSGARVFVASPPICLPINRYAHD